MADLNSLIQQRKILRKYQGQTNTNIVEETPETGFESGMGTQANPIELAEVPVKASRYPNSYYTEEDSEAAYETLDGRLSRYNTMWSAGTVPEIPFGTAEYGYKNQYTNGMYIMGDEFTFDVNKATHVSTVRGSSENNTQEILKVPINEYLYGRVETQEDRDNMSLQSEKEREILAIGEAPNKNDYNFSLDGEFKRFQGDLNAYQDKQVDYIYTEGNRTKGEGFYKDANGNWVKPSISEIKNAYNNLISQESKKENALGVQAGIRSDGSPTKENEGLLSEGSKDFLKGAAVMLVADDATVIGVVDDVLLPVIATALAVDAAASIPWSDIWAQTTSSGAYSDLSISAQNTLKASFETLTQTAIGERIYTTQNNLEGIMVPTANGEVFMSRAQISQVLPMAAANQMSDADAAYEEAFPSGTIEDGPMEVDLESGSKAFENEASSTMTATGPPPAPPEDNEDPDKEKGWRQRLAKSKDWGADKASKFNRLREGLQKWTGGKYWREVAKTAWKDQGPIRNMMKVITMKSGQNMVTRYGARISLLLATPGGREFVFGKDAGDVWSEESQKFISEFDQIMQSDSSDVDKNKKIETLFDNKGDQYFQDSVDFQNMRYYYPEDEVVEFESGYKAERDSVGDVYDFGSKKWQVNNDNMEQKQQGGFVNTNAQTPQFVQEFKQGGILKYQGNNNSNAIGLPAGYQGMESPYPSITTPNNTYTDMLNYDGKDGKFTQPGMAELNKYGFQNYNDWRSFIKKQQDFTSYDWNNTTQWGKQHQGAWAWTTQNRTEATTGEDIVVEEEDDITGTCGAGMMDDGQGNCIPIPPEINNTGGDGTVVPSLKTNKWAGAFKMAGDLGMSVIPAITAWNQANLMEGEVGEFGKVPDIESPIINIKAPVKEVDQQIATTNEDAVMTANLLKEKGASAAAILSVEKKRREAVSGLEAQKQDLLMKADNEGKKLTAGYYMDAEKQNQVKNIKMKLEEMDFRTATKKAKIDIMDNLMRTISGVTLDSRKMYSDKNIMAMVSTALTAGTGMMERKTTIKLMNSMGITEAMIRANGGDELYE